MEEAVCWADATRLFIFHKLRGMPEVMVKLLDPLPRSANGSRKKDVFRQSSCALRTRNMARLRSPIAPDDRGMTMTMLGEPRRAPA
jgi:hypothetical protein